MRNTLLIIDDSELDRAIFNEIFKRDYRVLRAATASEGIDLIRKNVLDKHSEDAQPHRALVH